MGESVYRVITVRNADLMESIAEQAAAEGIKNAAIVILIGAVDSFTVSGLEQQRNGQWR